MASQVRFTTRDLEALPDRLDDTRYELIEGELFVVRQPHWVHQLASLVLGGSLLDWSLESGLGKPNIAPGLIFSPEDDVAPDVIWVSNERMAQGLGTDGKLHLAPELVIEILSPGAANERRDREVKLKLYAVWGAEEYWLVDWRSRSVEVYRRSGDALVHVVTLVSDDVLTSPLLPDYSLPVARLWRLAGA